MLERLQNLPVYRVPQSRAAVTIGRAVDHGGLVWPLARAEKWGGRAWLEIAARGVEPRPGRPERLLQSGNLLEIDCQGPLDRGRRRGETHRIFPGSLKWEVVYETAADLPETFAVFDLSRPAGLTFHHQPELTVAELEEGCERPENVVGSYAVYWPDSGRYLRSDGTEIVNYETGKFCHIYRPEWVAANGERLWGVQEVVGSELRVAIPRQWIDSLGTAAFPLVLDPTFGYTSEGGTATGLGGDYLFAVEPHSPANNGTIDSIAVYCNNSHATNTYALRTALWLSDRTRIASSSSAVDIGNQVTNWYGAALALSGSISAASEYWIGGGADRTGTAGVFQLFYDAGAGFSLRYANIAGAVPPDPFPETHTTVASRKYSAYATYTESGGGTDYAQSITDSLGITDSSTRVAAALRTLAESEGLTDAATRAVQIARSIADAEGLTASVVSSMALLVEQLIQESLGLTDTASRIAGFVRTLQDQAGLVDEGLRATGTERTIDDSEGLTDLASKVSALLRELSDSEGLTDDTASTLILLISQLIEESIGLSDSQSKVSALVRELSDAAGLSDAVARESEIERLLADSEGLSDEITKAIDFLRSVAESEGLADDASSVLSGAITFLAAWYVVQRRR